MYSDIKKVFDGLAVVAPEEILRRYPSGAVLIATAVPDYARAIHRQLIDLGFPPTRIVCYDGWQYFEPWLPRVPDEVFIDAGAFDGGTSRQFVQWCGNCFERIHLFEPDPADMTVCRADSFLGGVGGKVEFVEAGR